MHVAKLRIPTGETGLVPAGTYFQRLASALREANEIAGNIEVEAPRRSAHCKSQSAFAHAR